MSRNHAIGIAKLSLVFNKYPSINCDEHPAIIKVGIVIATDIGTNKTNPFLAKRDLKYNIFRRFIKRQKKTFSRLKFKIKNKLK